MAQDALATAGETAAAPAGVQGVVDDWSRDKAAFDVPWGKAMMWIFLLSDKIAGLTTTVFRVHQRTTYRRRYPLMLCLPTANTGFIIRECHARVSGRCSLCCDLVAVATEDQVQALA